MVKQHSGDMKLCI